ncbi:oxidoreductase [Paenibacillus lemnae]|uniref:SDR family NAD(P)-dependent oxidoreductase n=1 Tax=Paenibacillus lemnae TaxID=1330551 RepID=A0A848M913_PAELE|nr:oxidoreductase [Paenibacillus lemnae]NMO96572.1 SDR family NAD(P)-dependent oxidoreductase [Paenibacillus lemnae]
MNQPQVWFVTGASRGFGREIVKDLLQRGDKVAATARNTESLSDLEFEEGQLLPLKLDVTNESQAIEAAKQAVEYFGRIDVLVNNAGFGVMGGVEEISDKEARQVFDTNVFGLLNVTRAVLPYMRKERSGRVLNLSSIGGLIGITSWGIYGSTKFAVEGISEALAQEVAHLGIKVTSVEPGFFRTDFLDSSSLNVAEKEIEDYAESVGKWRKDMAATNKQQPGDPVKAAKAMIDVAKSDNPPVHLMLGNDTVDGVTEKLENLQKEMKAWEHVSRSTDIE